MRSRAADALAKIGGPRVIEAALELIRDQDEDVRRAAIEILNQTKDERAVGYLIEATHDTDWWVRERAVDALAEIGSRARAAGAARRCSTTRTTARCRPWCARSASSATRRTSCGCCRCSTTPPKEVRLEVDHRPHAARRRQLRRRRARTTRGRRRERRRPDGEPRGAARRRGPRQPLLDAARSPRARARPRTAEPVADAARRAARTSTSLVDARPRRQQRLDISTLKPGDILEGRYKYIEKIGKGAFGTVLLMEDTVVEEQLILKFLNPNVSQDEEMMKRFVHELRYSRKITHRNVIRIYDFLYIRGNYAISMEYFPSHTLGNEIERQAAAAREGRRASRIDIATGMAVAHQSGIIHRDLKPANVLIDDDGPASRSWTSAWRPRSTRATRSSPRPAT